MKQKRALYSILAIAAIAIGGYVLFGSGEDEEKEPVQSGPERFIIGTSVEGRQIESFSFLPVREDTITEPDVHLLFVGGIHGGYEWNTVVLARMAMDYLESNPEIIPQNVKVSIVPMANPDGIAEVFGTTTVSAASAPPEEETVPGRFNARGVDLNRNFDCNWEPESFWRGEVVDAGSEAFSEPEARAIRNFVRISEPDAVVFWHSAASGVYGATCNGDGTGSELSFAANNLMDIYADASGYPAIATFDHYEITGDAEGWLAKIGIPSVSVELTSHEAVEWEKNLRGIKALLEEYGSK